MNSTRRVQSAALVVLCVGKSYKFTGFNAVLDEVYDDGFYFKADQSVRHKVVNHVFGDGTRFFVHNPGEVKRDNNDVKVAKAWLLY